MSIYLALRKRGTKVAEMFVGMSRRDSIYHTGNRTLTILFGKLDAERSKEDFADQRNLTILQKSKIGTGTIIMEADFVSKYHFWRSPKSSRFHQKQVQEAQNQPNPYV